MTENQSSEPYSDTEGDDPNVPGYEGALHQVTGEGSADRQRAEQGALDQLTLDDEDSE